MNIPPIIVPRSHLCLLHLLLKIRIPVLETAKSDPGAGLNDWLGVDTQEGFKIPTISGYNLFSNRLLLDGINMLDINI